MVLFGDVAYLRTGRWPEGRGEMCHGTTWGQSKYINFRRSGWRLGFPSSGGIGSVVLGAVGVGESQV